MNPYYEFDLPFLPATLARAEEVNTQFMAIQTGFDAVKIDVDFADTKAQEAAASAGEAATSAAEALVSETHARNFAEQTGSDVDDFDGEYSAREWATGLFVPSGSAMTWAFGTRPEGSAREWATKIASTVDGSDYSAKEWAVGDVVPAGSAKFWANTAVAATNYVGTYNPATPYTQGQIVDLDKRLYLLRVPTSTGVAPPDPIWLQLGTAIESLDYDERDDLRAIEGPEGALAVVDGLGIFEWRPVLDLDDDETAIVSTLGTWYLQATHPDTVFAHQIVEEEEQNARIEDLETFTETLPETLSAHSQGRIGLSSSVESTVTALNGVALVDYLATIEGAAEGDIVLVTSRGPLGSDASSRARINLVGYVSAPGEVTVSIRNPSANTANLNPSTIDVRVLKQL